MGKNCENGKAPKKYIQDDHVQRVERQDEGKASALYAANSEQKRCAIT